MTTLTEEETALVTTIDTILGPSPPTSLLFGAPAVSARQIENATHRKPGTLSETLFLKTATEVGAHRGKNAVLKTLQRAGKSEIWIIFRPSTNPPKPVATPRTLKLLAPPSTNADPSSSAEVSPAKSEKGAFWNKLLHCKAEPEDNPPEKIKIQLPAPHALAGQTIEHIDILMTTQSVDSVEGIPRVEIPMPPKSTATSTTPPGGKVQPRLMPPSGTGLRLPSPTRPELRRSPASSPNPAGTQGHPALRRPPPRVPRAAKPTSPIVKPITPTREAPGLVISLSDCDSDASEESPFALDVDEPTSGLHPRTTEEDTRGEIDLVLPRISGSTVNTGSKAVTPMKSQAPLEVKPSQFIPESSSIEQSRLPPGRSEDFAPTSARYRRSTDKRPTDPESEGQPLSVQRERHKLLGENDDMLKARALDVGRSRSSEHDRAAASRKERRLNQDHQSTRTQESRSKSHISTGPRSKNDIQKRESKSRSEKKSESKSRSKSGRTEDHRKRSKGSKVSVPPPTPWADVAFQDMPFRVHFPVAKVSYSFWSADERQ
jgi:hypothetical protein